jgi:3-(3-hydroxy-phenyl)propionate hydroxylase
MTPADGVERTFRDAVLSLAAAAPFARSLVNSGRLSRPCVYPSGGADAPGLPPEARPGSVAPDAPLGTGWLSEALGREPVLLCLGANATAPGARTFSPGLTDTLRRRYLGSAPSAVYLIRPDQIVAARWLAPDEAAISSAITSLWEGTQ